MKGKCALFEEETDLQLSHIYPKFAIKYLRNTSNGGRFRGYDNINQIKQDGLKIHLLGREGEKRFSYAETWFANKIFYPLVNNEQKIFHYNDQLYYFIMSLLWRALQIEIRSKSYESENYYSHLIECEKEWRLFLKSGFIPNHFKELYMMITHPNQLLIPTLPSTQYYLMRYLDLTIVSNLYGCVYVYIKLPRCLFWAPIRCMYSSNANSIDMQGGIFNSMDFPTDPGINGFIPNRIEQINNLGLKLSSAQEQATLSHINKDSESFYLSEAGQLFLNNK